MRQIHALALALALAGAAGSTACGDSRADATEANPASVDKAETARLDRAAVETDDRIESSFKKTYVYKTYLKNEKITIDSKNGIVTLMGSVADAGHKPMAGDTAEALPGVKSVENRIEIIGEQSASNSDAWIRARVTATLLFHRSVNHKAGIDVKDGIVTLTGENASQAQSDLTVEYAKDVEGVRAVKSEMTVAAASPEKGGQTISETIDDASITAQVKWSLLFHRSTSALKTKVSTKEGVVTLSGDAKNEAEKALVSKLVTDITGVNKVINNMTIGKTVSRND